MLPAKATVPKEDGRKSNRGAAMRESIDNTTKHNHLESCDMWLSEDETRTVAQCCKHFHPKECDKWNNRLSQWQKKQAELVQVESDRLHGKLKVTSVARCSTSPFIDMEAKLIKEIKDH